MSKKTIIYVVIGLVVVLGVVVLLTLKKAKASTNFYNVSNDSNNNSFITNLTPSVTNTVFPLQKGSTGVAVKLLQYTIGNAGNSLDVDGIFGNQTLIAVQSYYGEDRVSVSREEFIQLLTYESGYKESDITQRELTDYEIEQLQMIFGYTYNLPKTISGKDWVNIINSVF